MKVFPLKSFAVYGRYAGIIFSITGTGKHKGKKNIIGRGMILKAVSDANFV